MQKWVVYSTLCSVVVSLTVWIFTFNKTAEVQTSSFMRSFIATRHAELLPLHMALQEFYFSREYLPESLSELGNINGFEDVHYSRIEGFSRKTPYLNDTLKIHFIPVWDNEEFFTRYRCELDGRFNTKPNFPGCPWREKAKNDSLNFH